MPGRPREVREEARHAARYAVARDDRGAARLPAGGRARVGELVQVLARRLVRRTPFLQMARAHAVQVAPPPAARELQRPYRMPCRHPNSAQARCYAVEARSGAPVEP